MRGHIQRRGKSWRLTIDVGVDPVSGTRRRVTRTTRTKGEAEELARQLGGTGTPATNARTVGDLLDRWWAQAEADLSPSTRPSYRAKIDHYLKPELGALPLRKLTTAQIDDLYQRLRKRGRKGKPLSVSTVRRTHAVLARACAQGVRWGWMPTNPCTNASPGRTIRHEPSPPTAEEVRRILEAATAELDDAVQLALATGARRGELCGLRWADVDFKKPSVTFRRSVADVNKRTVVIEQRRKSRTRTVSIDPLTVQVLTARRRRARKLALAAGRKLEPTGYVLSEEPGQIEPLRPDRLTGRWGDAAKRVKSTARFHDLRHFHVTQLLAAGIPVRQVAARVGHASAHMTLDVYAHAVEALDERAAEVIAAAIDG